MKLKELNTPFERNGYWPTGVTEIQPSADISRSSESPETCIKAGRKL